MLFEADSSIRWDSALENSACLQARSSSVQIDGEHFISYRQRRQVRCFVFHNGSRGGGRLRSTHSLLLAVQTRTLINASVP